MATYTWADHATVKQAILDLVSGKRRVKFVIDGEVAEYAQVQLPELRALLAEIESYLAENDPESTTIRGFYFTGGKAL
jgi:hypothetical protein